MRIDKQFIATVCYADVFDYPLNLYEIWLWFIKRKISIKETKKLVWKYAQIKSKTESSSEVFVHLPQRSVIVKKRVKNRRLSRKKFGVASQIAGYIGLIPSVQLVAVTGSLAYDNAKGEDDIDLIIISKKNSIWTTRLLSIITVEIFSKRRKPGQKKFRNAICLNMFMTDNKLTLTHDERDLYSAHEALHMKPIIDKDGSYTNFLVSNSWIGDFLPNAYNKLLRENTFNKKYTSTKEVSLFVNFISIFYKTLISVLYNILIIFEKKIKNIQIKYMKNKQTTEIISDHILRFHPIDAREKIKERYEKRLSDYKVPLDKVFYSHIK